MKARDFRICPTDVVGYVLRSHRLLVVDVLSVKAGSLHVLGADLQLFDARSTPKPPCCPCSRRVVKLGFRDSIDSLDGPETEPWSLTWVSMAYESPAG